MIGTGAFTSYKSRDISIAESGQARTMPTMFDSCQYVKQEGNFDIPNLYEDEKNSCKELEISLKFGGFLSYLLMKKVACGLWG